MKLRALVGVALLLGAAGCTAKPPRDGVESTTPTTPTISTTGPITYTVEPFDMDGTYGIVMTVTQNQFGGKMCPCVKIPYPADGLHNQQGADAINAAATKFHAGDTLMGFSLGVQIISLFLSQHSLPAGVNVLLAGDTLAENARFVANGQGIPANIANSVTMVVNEYDGWSDSPDLTASPNYLLSNQNAVAGTQRLHYYANADINNPANVVAQQGNIKTILIPTQHLPQNDWLRGWDDSGANALDASQRPAINTAYSRASSTAAQQSAATAEQVPQPNPAWINSPEPVLGQ